MSSADFNGDGSPDLATANTVGSVSVLLGNGNGGFAAPNDFATGSGPRSVTSADFDGDGDPDLAIANYESDTVSILLGNGSGGFGAKTDFAVGHPWSVTSADFNGDGNPDLATSNPDSNNVSVLLGTDSGSLEAPSDFTVGRAPMEVTSADFDGDGDPDLATANLNDGTVSVLLGTGSGGFGAKTDVPSGSGPRSVTSADFDGDGDPDLATANLNDSTVSVLLGDGDGDFRPNEVFPVDASGDGPFDLTGADFDGDGNADLATANYFTFGEGSVSVLLGTGAPNAAITKRPKPKIKTKKKKAKVTVKFTSDDAHARFRCKLNKAAFKRCSSPYEVKARAKRGKGNKHKIAIKAKDEAGNVSDPAAVKFMVIRKGGAGGGGGAGSGKPLRLQLKKLAYSKGTLHAEYSANQRVGKRKLIVEGRGMKKKTRVKQNRRQIMRASMRLPKGKYRLKLRAGPRDIKSKIRITKRGVRQL